MDSPERYSEELEELVTPHWIPQKKELPASQIEVPVGLYVKASVSDNCQWGYMFHQSVLNCYRLHERNPEASTMINSTGYSFNGVITSACEVAYHNSQSMLLVGLSLVNTNGQLVLFDQFMNKPLKYITLPAAPTTITVLHNSEQSCGNRILGYAFENVPVVAIVGMYGGYSYIVDLALDDDDKFPNRPYHTHSEIAKYYKLREVEMDDFIAAEERYQNFSRKIVIGVELTNETLPCDQDYLTYFVYHGTNGHAMTRILRSSVRVTSVAYFHQLKSVIVGYNFGCFQIWNVSEPQIKLEFSSEYNVLQSSSVRLPVHSFSFQQPIDDPKMFCYVWVLYGKNSVCNASYATLFSLYYRVREVTSDLKYMYLHLNSCVPRFNLTLKDYFLPDHDGIDDPFLVRPIRMCSNGDHTRVFFFWDCFRENSVHVGVFDLDQWYSAHMTTKIENCRESGLCSFWSIAPITLAGYDSIVLDAMIIPGTISSWSQPYYDCELHSYPVSISFRGVVLTRTGYYHFEHLGIQKKIMVKVKDNISQAMVEPFELLELMKKYGIQPRNNLVYDFSSISELNSYRFTLLTIFLENGFDSQILTLAEEWFDGSFSKFGCTIRLLIDWMADFAQSIKLLAEEHWENMFTLNSAQISLNTISFLDYSCYIWSSLYKFCGIMMAPSEMSNTEDGSHLRILRYPLLKLKNYASVLRVFCESGLLPMSPTSTFLEDIETFYKQKRMRLFSSTQQSEISIQEAQDWNNDSKCLVIDCLLGDIDPEFLRKEWHSEYNEPIYPPKHIAYVMKLLMWTSLDQELLKKIFYYFLLDVVKYHEKNGTSNNHWSSFLAIMKSILRLSDEELSEVECIWKIDHEIDLYEVSSVLMQPNMFQRRGHLWDRCYRNFSDFVDSEVAFNVLSTHWNLNTELTRIFIDFLKEDSNRLSTIFHKINSNANKVAESVIKYFLSVAEEKSLICKLKNLAYDHPNRHFLSVLLRFFSSCDTFSAADHILSIYLELKDYNNVLKQLTKMEEHLKKWCISSSETFVWDIRSNIARDFLRYNRKKTFLRYPLGSILENEPLIDIDKPNISRPDGTAAERSSEAKGKHNDSHHPNDFTITARNSEGQVVAKDLSMMLTTPGTKYTSPTHSTKTNPKETSPPPSCLENSVYGTPRSSLTSEATICPNIQRRRRSILKCSDKKNNSPRKLELRFEEPDKSETLANLTPEAEVEEMEESFLSSVEVIHSAVPANLSSSSMEEFEVETHFAETENSMQIDMTNDQNDQEEMNPANVTAEIDDESDPLKNSNNEASKLLDTNAERFVGKIEESEEVPLTHKQHINLPASKVSIQKIIKLGEKSLDDESGVWQTDQVAQNLEISNELEKKSASVHSAPALETVNEDAELQGSKDSEKLVETVERIEDSKVISKIIFENEISKILTEDTDNVAPQNVSTIPRTRTNIDQLYTVERKEILGSQFDKDKNEHKTVAQVHTDDIKAVPQVEIDSEAIQTDENRELSKTSVTIQGLTKDVETDFGQTDVKKAISETDIDPKSDMDIEISKADVDKKISKSDFESHLTENDEGRDTSKAVDADVPNVMSADLSKNFSEAPIERAISESEVDKETSQIDIDEENSQTAINFEKEILHTHQYEGIRQKTPVQLMCDEKSGKEPRMPDTDQKVHCEIDAHATFKVSSLSETEEYCTDQISLSIDLSATELLPPEDRSSFVASEILETRNESEAKVASPIKKSISSGGTGAGKGSRKKKTAKKRVVSQFIREEVDEVIPEEPADVIYEEQAEVIPEPPEVIPGPPEECEKPTEVSNEAGLIHPKRRKCSRRSSTPSSRRSLSPEALITVRTTRSMSRQSAERTIAEDKEKKSHSKDASAHTKAETNKKSRRGKSVPLPSPKKSEIAKARCSRSFTPAPATPSPHSNTSDEGEEEHDDDPSFKPSGFNPRRLRILQYTPELSMVAEENTHIETPMRTRRSSSRSPARTLQSNSRKRSLDAPRTSLTYKESDDESISSVASNVSTNSKKPRKRRRKVSESEEPESESEGSSKTKKKARASSKSSKKNKNDDGRDSDTSTTSTTSQSSKTKNIRSRETRSGRKIVTRSAFSPE